LTKANASKVRELQKDREPASKAALSLYDMIYLAKCYPGKINPGIWQDGLNPITALRLGTASRGQGYPKCPDIDDGYNMREFGTRTYTVFALCNAMTIFPFANAGTDKMSGFSMLQTDNPDADLEPLANFTLAGASTIGMQELWGSDMDSIA
jgi:hypothetical protein